MTTVLAFGTFDGLHPGHVHMLSQASALGDRLVLSLATDDDVRARKGRAPRHSYAKRAAALRQVPGVNDVLPSDSEHGSFRVIADVNPDVFALGYDQAQLREALEHWMREHRQLPIIMLEPYQPELYKSSILNS